MVQWRKVKASAARAGRTPSTMDLGFSVHARRDWVDKASRAEEQRSRPPRRISFAADRDQVVLQRARRPRLSAWGKAKEVWRDLDVVGLVALTLGCGLFLLPFTLAAGGLKGWHDRELGSFPSPCSSLTVCTTHSRDLGFHRQWTRHTRLLRLLRVQMVAHPCPPSATTQEPNDRCWVGTRLLPLPLAVLLRELLHQLPAVSHLRFRFNARS